MSLVYRLVGIWDYAPKSEQQLKFRQSIWHNARGNGMTNDMMDMARIETPIYAPIIRLALEHRVIRQMVRDISRQWERLQG